MHVEFRLLGPLEVRVGGEPLPLPGTRLRTLLAALLVRRGEVVPVDRLVEDVWAENAPQGARHALETHAWKLRTALGAAATLSAHASGYLLDVPAGSVDADRFEQLLAEARDAPPARAAVLAADALGLWRGPALADVTYAAFAQAEIARLEELRLEAEEERIDAELALGRASESIGEIEALVAAAPVRERRRGQLMLALYRSGRQADALDAYRDARAYLRDELGLEPGDALRELERSILRHDHALAVGSVQERPAHVNRRLVSLVAVVPAISLELDIEAHDLESRQADVVVRRIAAEYGAELPEPFVMLFAHEDHAERAAAGAAAIAHAIHAGVAVVTGEALVGEGTVGGPLVTRARQQAMEATPGELRVDPVESLQRRLDGPFVGRHAEVELLRDAPAAIVVGPPGVGKSRLAHELARSSFAAVGRCTAYASGPLTALEEIAAALGSPDALQNVPAVEVPSTFRRLCAGAGPGLLLVVDDVQWADPLVVDTIEHVAAAGGTRVLCVAREELLENHPSFLPAAQRLALEPLTQEDAQELARQLALVEDSAVVERALAAAEGNPLFIEQLIAHAAEGGGSAPPPTLRSLLAARLDHLTQTERAVIEHAAVVGREFDASIVAELLAEVSVRHALAALVRRRLLDPAPPTSSFDERFRFRHVLIQETAYAASAGAERARLHERLADLLDTRGADDELVGFHLERASELRPERDRHARRLAEDAGRHLGAAGMTVWKRGFAPHASSLLGRATELLPRADERRRELLCELGVALNTAGETAAAIAALEEAASSGDRRIECRAEIELGTVRLLTQPQADPDELLSLIDRALPVFEAVGDDRSLGRAWMLAGWVHGGFRCRNERWGECATRALAHYRHAGMPSSTCIGHIAAAAYFGPMPSTAGAGRCRELLEHDVDDRPGEANVLVHLGGLESMLGDFDAGLARVAAAREIYADLGRSPTAVRTCAPIEAEIARLMGDEEHARAVLDESCALLREQANWGHYAAQSSDLAAVLCALGRVDDARQALDAAQPHVITTDVFARVAFATASAVLLMHEGERPAAEVVAREAVELAETSDASNRRAAALLALAAATEDESAVVRALQLYEEKENAAAASRLRADAAASSRSIV